VAHAARDGRYLQGDTYFWLREHPELSNPDQRIADDVRTFTASTLSLGLIVLNTTFTILAFSGVLWTISPQLFIAAVLYAAGGSAVAILFGRPLIGLNYDQSDREASLRSELVQLRENAESVATVRGENHVAGRLAQRVTDLVAKHSAHHRRQPQPRLLHDGVQLPDPDHPGADRRAALHPGEGGVRRDHAIVDGLRPRGGSLLADHHAVPADLFLRRRDAAAQGLMETVDQVASKSAGGIAYDDTGAGVAWERVTLRAPGVETPLVDSLSVSVSPGTRVLVTGAREGVRERPVPRDRGPLGRWRRADRATAPDAILFVPERPYLPWARSARRWRQMGTGASRRRAHPGSAAGAGIRRPDPARRRSRRRARLERRVRLGELQTLSFARRPARGARFAVLDRPTTLLGAEVGLRALDLLAAKSITAITFAADGRARGATRRSARALGHGRLDLATDRTEGATA
jgi:putative ATP-binding cassette transporter